MPKVNGRYKKKPSIPNYNTQVLKTGQVSREVLNKFRATRTKVNDFSINLRKSQ